MSHFPPRLAPLVQRRLAHFVLQQQIPFANSLPQKSSALVQIIRQNITSGRYARFEKHDKSRARLTPTRYVDRVIETWFQESPRWTKLVQHDSAAWKDLCQWLAHAAEKWIRPKRSLRGFTAEDFAQQAIVLMLKADYPFDVPFDPWALTILHRVIWGKVRADKDVMDHEPESLDEMLSLGDVEGTGMEKQVADPLAHRFVRMAHDRDLLWQAMAGVPPKLNIVLEWFFFDGLTDEEIARKLNTTIANVQTRRHRALKRLHDLLARESLSEKRLRPH